jgi:hypothetical protein
VEKHDSQKGEKIISLKVEDLRNNGWEDIHEILKKIKSQRIKKLFWFW